MKFLKVVLFCLSLSGCVTLSEEGAQVKVVFPRGSVLEALKSCERLQSMNFHPSFLSNLSVLMKKAKNEVAKVGGNVVVSKSLVMPIEGQLTGFKGVAYNCSLEAYDSFTSEEDY